MRLRTSQPDIEGDFKQHQPYGNRNGIPRFTERSIRSNSFQQLHWPPSVRTITPKRSSRTVEELLSPSTSATLRQPTLLTLTAMIDDTFLAPASPRTSVDTHTEVNRIPPPHTEPTAFLAQKPRHPHLQNRRALVLKGLGQIPQSLLVATLACCESARRLALCFQTGNGDAHALNVSNR